MPGLTNDLARRLAHLREAREAELKEDERQWLITQELRSGYELVRDLTSTSLKSQEREIEELQEKLRLAEAREEALKGAIALLRPA